MSSSLKVNYVYQKTPFSKHVYLAWILAQKSLKLRYKNSVLGFVWSMLTPLLYLAIFTFIFSQAFHDIENYPLFALTGLIFWNFFSNSTNGIINVVIDSRGVLKSINIPTILLPVAETLSMTFNLFLSFIPFSILMWWFNAQIGWETLMFIPVFILFVLFAFGVGIFICAINIYFRDVGLLWTTLMPAVFYFTPIAYSSSLIPAKYAWIMKFNPVFHYIEGFRTVLYYNQVPDGALMLTMTAITAGTLGFGLWVFFYLQKGFISNY